MDDLVKHLKEQTEQQEARHIFVNVFRHLHTMPHHGEVALSDARTTASTHEVGSQLWFCWLVGWLVWGWGWGWLLLVVVGAGNFKLPLKIAWR